MVKCFVCGRSWSDIHADDDLRPNDDNTYDHSSGTFLCDSCYIKVGIPLIDEVDKMRKSYLGNKMSSNYSTDFSIDYPDLHFLTQYLEDVDYQGFISGGCFKDIFSHKKVKDIDIFFNDKSKFDSAEDKLKGNSKYKKAYSSNNVVAYRNESTGMVLELIKKVFGDPTAVMDDFDFSITKFALYSEPDKGTSANAVKVLKVRYDKDFFKHLTQRRLVLDGNVLYPLSTFTRMLKYTRYGYNICKDSKVTLLQAIQNQYSADDLSTAEFDDSFYEGVD